MSDLIYGSPKWWLVRLSKKLNERIKATKVYDDYYESKHNLAFASITFKNVFGDLFTDLADNWCELIIDATEERLNVDGFRIGRDPESDTDAWKMWQANQLDLESQMAHTDAMIMGESAVIIWNDPDRPDIPLMTVEHPHQVIVAHAAGNRRRRAAALKRWRGDDGVNYATVYLPDGVYKYQSSSRASVFATAASGEQAAHWKQRQVDGEDWPLANPLGVVPVVPLVNKPRLLKPGRSEIAQVIPLQDAVNKLLADMLIAAEFESFRQRYATGLELPTDDDGKVISDFRHAIDRLWVSADHDTKFGEFSPHDLTNFTTAIDMIVQHLASKTRTPPHYFYLSGQFPSGETIKSAETGLVAKVTRKQRSFGESWEEVIRLGFAVLDDGRSDETASETIWADPESRTESEHVDAVVKRRSLGVPDEQLQEDAGYTPQQISRFSQMAGQSGSLKEKAEAVQMLEELGYDRAEALQLVGLPTPGATPDNN